MVAHSSSPSPSSSQQSAGQRATTTTLHLDDFACQLRDLHANTPFPLYGISVSGRTVSCYVEAEHDRAFYVYVRGKRQEHDHDARLLIGGNDLQGMLLTAEDPGADFIGRKKGDQVLPYTFFPIETSGSKFGTACDPKIVEDLGVVELCLKRTLAARPRKFNLAHAAAADPFKNCKPVHEELKSIGRVRFALGDAVPRPRGSTGSSSATFSVEYDTSVPPLRFVFRCMTRFGLELKGVLGDAAPAGRSRKRSHEGDDEDEDEDEQGGGEAEAQRILARIERIKKRRAQLQLEGDEDRRAQEEQAAAQVKLEEKRDELRLRNRERLARHVMQRQKSGGGGGRGMDVMDEDGNAVDAETLGLTRPITSGPGTAEDPLTLDDSDDEHAVEVAAGPAGPAAARGHRQTMDIDEDEDEEEEEDEKYEDAEEEEGDEQRGVAGAERARSESEEEPDVDALSGAGGRRQDHDDDDGDDDKDGKDSDDDELAG